MEFTHWIVPVLLTSGALLTLRQGKDPYFALISGTKDGILLIPRIFPALLVLLTAGKMLRESGFFEIFGTVFGPILGKIGIPAELLPLILLQPLSGSGSLAIAGEIMQKHGAASKIGRLSGILLGSSETTFYTISVYFGGAGISESRHAVISALIGDFFGVIAAVLAEKWLF